MSNRLTIKGQVTIPKEVRDFLGLTAGASAIDFSIEADGTVRISKAQTVKPKVQTRGGNSRSSGGFDHSACDRVLALLSGSFA